jgi:uncharacterized protein YukE
MPYVSQVQDAQRSLAAQSNATLASWRDAGGKRFFEQYIERFSTDIEKYVGGLEQTLKVMRQCEQEMAELSDEN